MTLLGSEPRHWKKAKTLQLQNCKGCRCHSAAFARTDVSIRIPPRSIIGLIGPNGAGKTTLLGVLSGLIRPDCGRITLAETDVAGNAPETFARRGVSWTFQHADLFAELTVRDHLVLASRSSHQQHHLLKDMLGLTRHNGLREEDFEIDEMMRTLGIDLYSRHLPSEIPLGTRRLVEIAEAILGKPRLILLDEPSAGLDSVEARNFGQVLKRAQYDNGFSVSWSSTISISSWTCVRRSTSWTTVG